MSVTAPDPDLPDWLGHWALKALVPVALAAVYVRLADASLAGPAVFVAVFEAMLLFTLLEDDGHIGERTMQLGTGAVALAGAGLLVALDGGVFVSALASLGLFSVGRAVVAGRTWSLSSHGFSAREGGPPAGHPAPGDPRPDDPVRDEILTALADRPHTRRELWEAVDGGADAVDDTLATLRDEGTVVRTGSEFRLDRSA